MGFAIIFSGSRTLSRRLVYTYLSLYNFEEIYIGDCKTGGDKYALEYAKEHGIKYYVFEALWNIYGRAAGVIRNELMVKTALEKRGRRHLIGLVIIKDGSKGAKNMISQLQKYHIYYRPYYIVRKGYKRGEMKQFFLEIKQQKFITLTIQYPLGNEIMNKEIKKSSKKTYRFKTNENVKHEDVA